VPPLVIASFEVMRFDNRLYLKVSFEGARIKLFQQSGDSFFPINLIPFDTPEFDSTFVKNNKGHLAQMIIEADIIGSITLNARAIQSMILTT